MALDANGWTILSPSVDSRVIYVSSSTGSDANGGLSPAFPKRTLNGITGARSLLRTGFPDHMLLKSGDTFDGVADPDQSLNGFNKVGRSASEPMVISHYGNLARPVIRSGGGSGFSMQNTSSARCDYIAIVGVHFRGRDSNPYTTPGGISLSIQGTDILVEDCYFERYQISIGVDPAPQGDGRVFSVVSTATNILSLTAHGYINLMPVRIKQDVGTIPGGLIHDYIFYVVYVDANQFRLSTTADGLNIVDITTTGTGRIRGVIQNITVRRNLITKNYAYRNVTVSPVFDDPSNSHGIYSSDGFNWLVEGNTFWHCGWLSPGDPIGVSRDGSIFDHCIYFLSSCQNTAVRDNYFLEPATTGLSGRVGGFVTGNVCIRCPIALLSIVEIGFFWNETVVHGNVIMEGRNIANPNGGAVQSRGWGIQVHGMRLRAEITNNLIVDVDEGGQAFGIEVNSSNNWRYNATPLCDYVVTDNVVVDWPTSFTFQPSGDEHVTHPAYSGGPSAVLGSLPDSRNFNSLTLERNTIQGTGLPLLNFTPTTFSGDPNSTWAEQRDRIDGADNKVYSSGTSNTVNASGSGGLGTTTLAAWKTAVGDTTSAATETTFPDPTRNAASYSGTIGGELSFEGFVDLLLQQSRHIFRSDLLAEAFVAYMQEGFGMGQGVAIVGAAIHMPLRVATTINGASIADISIHMPLGVSGTINVGSRVETAINMPLGVATTINLGSKTDIAIHMPIRFSGTVTEGHFVGLDILMPLTVSTSVLVESPPVVTQIPTVGRLPGGTTGGGASKPNKRGNPMRSMTAPQRFGFAKVPRFWRSNDNR